MDTSDLTSPSLEDIGRARRSLQEAEMIARKAKVLPGDPGNDVGRQDSDDQQQQQQHERVEAALQDAKEVGRQLRTRVMAAGEPRLGEDKAPQSDTAAKDRGSGGLLSAAGHAMSSAVGALSESIKTGVASVSGAVTESTRGKAPSGPGDADGGVGVGVGKAVRVRDMLGGSNADTPYPGDMVDEPVQLEGAEQDGTSDKSNKYGGQVVGGVVTPHVDVSEQRRRDPDLVTPMEGGPGTTIRDSGVMINTGPTAGGGARAQGFGSVLGSSGVMGREGGTLGVLEVMREAIASVTGAHTVDGSVGGFSRVAAVAPEGDEAARMAALRQRMEGMPGSMPIDREIREQREAEAEERIAALAAQREAVSAAAREGLKQRHPDVVEHMGLRTHQYLAHEGIAGQEAQADERRQEREATAAAGGGGGGLLTSFVHTLGDVLGLGGGRVALHDREQQQQQQQQHRAAAEPLPLERKPVPSGTSPLEAKPLDKTAIGVPAAAEADAERGRTSIHNKESGQEVPAGALGATATDPAKHNPSFAPDFNKLNLFSEVEKRGVGDVLAAGAASFKGSVERAMEEFRHGGAPAPGTTTAGAVADTKDIARNVERVDHLDDPVQRRIYDAEVERVAPGKTQAASDRRSEAEAVKEATSSLVLGKDRQVSGTQPHGAADSVHPAPPLKQQAGGQSIRGSFGTGSAAPRRGREVKDAYEKQFRTVRSSDDGATATAAAAAAVGIGGGAREEDGMEQLRDQVYQGPQQEHHQRQQYGSDPGDTNIAAGASARRSGLTAWAGRVGAAFVARAGGTDEGDGNSGGGGGGGGQQSGTPTEGGESEEQTVHTRQPYNRYRDDPAGYAESRVHSGAPAGSRAQEPSGKEVKDVQYLKVYEEPHSKIMHIQGANFNWDRNKDREAAQATTATDNPTLFETAGRAIHKAVTGEHYEGVPPMGHDSRGGRETPFIEAKDNLMKGLKKASEIGPDIAWRTEESVVGVLEHVSEAAEAAVAAMANAARSGFGDQRTAEERMAEAAEQQEQREVLYEQDPSPAAQSSVVRQLRLDQMDQAVDPALKRETLVDKLLYPWSKDASTDDSKAREMAKSYHEYVREKEAKGDPYDPLGAMAHDREYDTSKLPATVQQVERSRVDTSSGERSGNNQEFLRERAPYAGQAGPMPEGVRSAIRSLAEDTAAHGRTPPRGLEGLQERVEEEEQRPGNARWALRNQGVPENEEDRRAYRDPHSDRAWHAAEVLQTNIDRTRTAASTAGAATEGSWQQQQQQQQQEGKVGVGDAVGGAAWCTYAGQKASERVGGAEAQTAGTVRGAAEAVGQEVSRAVGAAGGVAEVAGEEVRRVAGGAVGAVRGAAGVAGQEAERAAGAAGGAAVVAGEEASRATGGLLGTIRQGLRELVGGGRGSDSGRQESSRPQPQATGYSDVSRAVADLYHEQKPRPREGRKDDESAEQRGEEAARVVQEDIARRVEGAATVIGSTARETAESANEAVERVVERTEEATEQARESVGGLLGALRGLFVGGGGEQSAEGGDQQRRQREGRVVERAEAEDLRGTLFERAGDSSGDDRATGVSLEDVSEGVGRVAGGIAGVLEKVLGGAGEGKRERGDAAAPAGPDAPVVPYTSTAEIMEARHREEEQH